MAMTSRVRYAVEADVPGLCKVNVLSFTKRRFKYALFPQADVPTLLKFMSFGSFKHLADPQMHVVTVDDPATKDIIAYARWQIPDSLDFHQVASDFSEKGAEAVAMVASNPMLYAPQPCNDALFTAFKKMIEESRKKHTTDHDISES